MQLQLNLQDPAVQAALVGAVGSIVTAAIAALCAGLIGQQISGRRRLAEKLLLAQRDIEFLLSVEQAHCEARQAAIGQSMKNTVRKSVKERGLSWSGKFTPGRVLRPELDRHHII